MPKPVLGIDVDEVLMPFTPTFLAAFNKRHGTSHKPEDMNNYFYIEDLTGISGDEAEDVIEEFLASDHGQAALPHNGAIEAIEKLKTKYEIDIITARRHTMRGSTELWLKRHFPGTFRNVHFSRPAQDLMIPKFELCLQLGVSVLIDDHLNNLKNCAQHGIQALCFGDYAWNREENLPDGITRVKDWNEVLRILM